MFYKIKNVNVLQDYKLSIQFSIGVTKIYDVKPLIDKFKPFNKLKINNDLFNSVYVGEGGYGIVFDDDINIKKVFVGGIEVA